MSELENKQALPEKLKASQAVPAQSDEDMADLKKNLLAQVKKMAPIIFGLSPNDPNVWKQQILDQVKRLIKNPGQYSVYFWDLQRAQNTM